MRAPICRVREVKHEDNHCVFQFGGKHPPCFKRVGDLEDVSKENPEISMVPVTGIGWIEIYRATKGATTQAVSAREKGLCVFLARKDTTRPWSNQTPESMLCSSPICQFTELLVSVANGTAGDYPPCIDEEGLQWLRKKGIACDEYRSHIPASSRQQSKTPQPAAGFCICMENLATHSWSNCKHPEAVVCKGCGETIVKRLRGLTECPVCRTKGNLRPFKTASHK